MLAGHTQLLVLTKEEKELWGGYGAILISWSKLLKIGKVRTNLVKELKKTLLYRLKFHSSLV
ncbi:MAG: hypothetical protein ACI8XB_000890 [Patiriisocius sp.]